jgi:hypothetical protein
MPTKSQPPLQLTTQPSVRLRQFIVVVHVLALAACLANALAVMYKIGLIVFVAGHYCRTRMHNKSQAWQIRHDDTKGWQIWIDGQFQVINILGSTVTTTIVILLHFYSKDRGRQNIAIPYDALPTDDFRQLIARLRTSTTK